MSKRRRSRLPRSACVVTFWCSDCGTVLFIDPHCEAVGIRPLSGHTCQHLVSLFTPETVKGQGWHPDPSATRSDLPSEGPL